MTFGQFWSEYHTLISLTLGILITFAVFKISKFKILWKILIVLVAMSLLTGLLGILKYLGLVLAIGFIIYGGFISIWVIGIIATTCFLASYSWDLKWWQFFLIGAAWGPISILLDILIPFFLMFIINTLGIAIEKLPERFRKKLNKKINL